MPVPGYVWALLIVAALVILPAAVLGYYLYSKTPTGSVNDLWKAMGKGFEIGGIVLGSVMAALLILVGGWKLIGRRLFTRYFTNIGRVKGYNDALVKQLAQIRDEILDKLPDEKGKDKDGNPTESPREKAKRTLDILEQQLKSNETHIATRIGNMSRKEAHNPELAEALRKSYSEVTSDFAKQIPDWKKQFGDISTDAAANRITKEQVNARLRTAAENVVEGINSFNNNVQRLARDTAVGK